MLYRIPGDLNEGEQRGNLFVIQGIFDRPHRAVPGAGAMLPEQMAPSY
jgi:hypothetical protein